MLPNDCLRHRPVHLVAAILLILAAYSAPVHAAGLMVSSTGGLLDIEQHDVHVTINNGIAVTQVTQVFRNLENCTVEALYTFPVPSNASVAGFSMWINGKEMIGEVIEKQAAREIYNSYKTINRDPGLLEQSDYRTFELRIFPIVAGALQKVQVTYYQELDADGPWSTYVYPLASNARKTVNSRVTKSFSITMDVKSALPIAEMHSPSHGRDLVATRFSPTYSRAVISSSHAGLDRDVVLAYRLDKAETVKLLASTPPDADGYFCLLLTAGDELKPTDTGMDYVFLLDISGSMRDDGKLGESRGTLAAFINMLGEDDRFDVLAFNTATEAAFGQLAGADAVHKKGGGDFLASRRARGGTRMTSALAAAYRYATPGRLLNIIVISDGLTERNQLPALVHVVNKRPADSRILCVGVGNDVDRALLQRMADASGGLAAFVSADDDFQRQAHALQHKLQRPAITDASVEIAGVNVRDLEPRTARNLFAGVPVRVYGRYSAGGPAQVTLSGKVEGKPWSQTFAIDFPDQVAENPEIERMWAWRRVDRLLNDDAGRSSAGAIDQIIRLGQMYSIATEYTSFIVLENDAEYAHWKIAQRNALRLTEDREAQSHVEDELRLLRQKTPGGLGDPSAAPAADPSASPAPAAGIPPTARNDTPVTQLRNSPNEMAIPHVGGAMDPTYLILIVAVGGIAWFSRRRPANSFH